MAQPSNLRPQILEYFARMNAKKSEDTGDDTSLDSDGDFTDSPLATNLRWEAKQKEWKLEDLCKQVIDHMAGSKKRPESIAVNVTRHWDGTTRNPGREYKEAYQTIFGYEKETSITSPLHVKSRTPSSKLKHVAKSEVTTTVFEAAGRAKASTVNESIELATELLKDPEWSPYIAMALHFLKLSR